MELGILAPDSILIITAQENRAFAALRVPGRAGAGLLQQGPHRRSTGNEILAGAEKVPELRYAPRIFWGTRRASIILGTILVMPPGVPRSLRGMVYIGRGYRMDV